MSEVLTAPRVITGDQTVTDGAVVIGDLPWTGSAPPKRCRPSTRRCRGRTTRARRSCPG